MDLADGLGRVLIMLMKHERAILGATGRFIRQITANPAVLSGSFRPVLNESYISKACCFGAKQQIVSYDGYCVRGHTHEGD